MHAATVVIRTADNAFVIPRSTADAVFALTSLGTVWPTEWLLPFAEDPAIEQEISRCVETSLEFDLPQTIVLESVDARDSITDLAVEATMTTLAVA